MGNDSGFLRTEAGDDLKDTVDRLELVLAAAVLRSGVDDEPIGGRSLLLLKEALLRAAAPGGKGNCNRRRTVGVVADELGCVMVLYFGGCGSFPHCSRCFAVNSERDCAKDKRVPMSLVQKPWTLSSLHTTRTHRVG